MHYYKRHIGDYTKDTAHLTLLEHGVYTRLIDVYCANEAPIPDKQRYRCIGARSKDEKSAVDEVLNEFFILKDGFWLQNRCAKTISEYHNRAGANRANGAKGGRPRKTQE